jgi:FkbM family methyltransferase
MSPTIERSVEKSKYEKNEERACLALCQPEETILELGGGLGYISASLRKNSRAARIVVCEANPALIPYMERVYELNDLKGIELRHCVALPTRSESLAPFYIREDMWASSLDENVAPYVRSILVPTISWRHLLDEVRPTALVIDIEGGEVDILPLDLGPIRRIVVELHPVYYGQVKEREIIDGLIGRGFRVREDLSHRTVWALER